MNKKIVIGIEGPVGSGKTSICRKLLEQKEGFNAPKKFWHERNSLFFADYNTQNERCQ